MPTVTDSGGQPLKDVAFLSKVLRSSAAHADLLLSESYVKADPEGKNFKEEVQKADHIHETCLGRCYSQPAAGDLSDYP